MKLRFLWIILFSITACSGVVDIKQDLTVKSYLNDKPRLEVTSCSPILNRESRDFHFSWNPYLNRQEGYRLTRIGSVYNVFLKIVTKSPTPNKDNVYEYKKLSKNLVKKWGKCFSKINDNMMINEKKIRLHLVDYNVDHSMPFAIIQNKSSEVEINDQLWLSELSCGELVKMSFSLIGLSDEKPDEKYSCRGVSPKNSPMNDIDEALYHTKKQGYEFVTYRCECDSHHNKNCHQLLAKGHKSWGENGQYHCPKDTYLIKKYFLKKDLWSWGTKSKHKILKFYGTSFQNLSMKRLCEAYGKLAGAFSHCEPLEFQSLLKPAHFRAILYPHCRKKNSLYIKCSQGAYKNKGCQALPRKCFDKKALWLL